MIANTIQKDLKKIAEEGQKIERELRAERIKLIRAKVEESGGDVKGLNDAGMEYLYAVVHFVQIWLARSVSQAASFPCKVMSLGPVWVILFVL